MNSTPLPEQINPKDNQKDNLEKQDNKKLFGTFKGVYLPSVLTIFGVIMYLRLGWVVGNVGLPATLLIVTIASLITFITGLSISATATNMKVKGGGAYFMISRSFGVEAGAAVGIPLFLAQAVGISFYVAGFSESINNLFHTIPIELIGVISLILLTILAYTSADLALKAQLFIFFIIIASLVSLFLGGTPKTEISVLNTDTLRHVPFWIAFAVFFPAVTGIEAGISMSGDLKDPAKSLPWGTLLAVLTGYIVYMIIPVFLSRVATADMLISNPMLMKDIAFIGELILLGIWGATLSSALGALLGAPRTLQALARDKVLPQFLGKGFGPSDTPRTATIISFIIALIGILLGGINTIAPILSMFFLTSYGVLNLIAGVEGLIGNPSWRPTFRVPWLISLIGSGLCVIAMLMINAGATLMSVIVILFVYFVMIKRDINTRWSDIRRSILLFLARFSIYRLENSTPDARSWRPNILVLSGSPTQRFYLIHLADAITHGKGFLTVASIISSNLITEERVNSLEKSIKEFLRKRDVPALVEVIAADDVISGAMSLVKIYGLGPLTPNTFLLGETEKKENFNDFAELLITICKSKKNIIIVREEMVSKKSNKNKQICVWWGGRQKNADFMLAIGHMLQTSPEWRGAELILKTIVKKEEDRENTIENINEFLAQRRVQARSEVIVGNTEEDIIATTIKRHSQKADLVFIGMRHPEIDESPQEYAVYYEDLINRTKDFPSIALILSAEDIKFSDIFQ